MSLVRLDIHILLEGNYGKVSSTLCGARPGKAVLNQKAYCYLPATPSSLGSVITRLLG